MEKNEIIEQIEKMSDKQKAKVLSIVLDEYQHSNSNDDFGQKAAAACPVPYWRPSYVPDS